MTPRACTPRPVLVSSRVSFPSLSSSFFILLYVDVLTRSVTPTDFTGISAPYEAPANPELHIKTNEVDIAGGVKIIVEYLEANKFI